MIIIGFASADPEDVSFIASDAFRERILRNKNWEIKMISFPMEASSVDVLLLPANKVNKLVSMAGHTAWPWVLISSRKSDALRAWELGAAYFLLRPFTLDDFHKALERAVQCFYWKNQISPASFYQQNLELLLTKGRKLSVQEKDILFLEARGEVTCVHLNLPGQDKIIATRNLGYWERQLPGATFFRVHKKFLVNLEYITSLLPEEIQLQQHILPVAKRRRKAVERMISTQQVRRWSGAPP